MNPREMGARDRRVLVLGAASISLIMFLGRGLPAWFRWSASVRASAASLVAKAERARESARRFPATRDSLTTRRRRLLGLAPMLANGETPAIAGARLASFIATTAEESNLRLGSVQVRTDSGEKTLFTRLSVRADVTGDVRGVMAFLGAIERGPTLLAVRSLSLSQPEPNAPADRVEALHAELMVDALMPTSGGASKRTPATRTP